ncbi:hypothetical protein GIB67_005832 [Kingdonia uniflora]|uniref:Uncharacterized protein n=1 Tax=Kingdonia uniflora TaxID=39325 RepID=A0A7J7LUE9_9MAGN|nr:hypothetical protein GIB67_005832 [Kingdonia uniflora]
MLIPNMAYFEFIPVDKNGEAEGLVGEAEGLVGEAVDLVDVKLRKHYELVVTTFAGLNRFRVGDILMVTRFYTRKQRHGYGFPDISSMPGHYVLYWELKMGGGETLPKLRSMTLKQYCDRLKKSLDYAYKKCRSEDKAIGPLEIRVVKYGAFDALMDLFVSQGSSVLVSSGTFSLYRPLPKFFKQCGRVSAEIQKFKLRYFGDLPLEMPASIPILPAYQGLSEEEAAEAEEFFYYMSRFYHVVLTAGRMWNDNVIWVKGDCLLRDNEEPVELLCRTVKQSPSSKVQRKKPMLDTVTQEGTKLEDA